jgi:large subunit ribosomal protein L1
MAETKTTSSAAKPAAKKAPATKPAPKKAPASPSGQQFRGKRYRAAAEQVEDGKQYGLDEAVALVQKTSTIKFDGTVEVHIRLGIDAREAEQSVRGTVQLPAGTGKDMKVMAFVPSGKAAAAKKAGAEFVSDEATLKKLAGGWIGFDVAVATPDQMVEVGKLGKVLGPKGLMPNPKSGTVAEDVEDAIKKVKAGSIEFRVAKDATIHAGVGKASFKAEDLAKNVATYFKAVRAAKPSDVKGTYIRSVTLASTMGPGVRVNPDSIIAAAQ